MTIIANDKNWRLVKCLQNCFYLPVLFYQTVTCSLDNPGPVSYRRPIKTWDYEQAISYSQITVQPTVPRHRDTCNWHTYNSRKWRSQNAEKATHIKGKLLDQAVILFLCVTFQNGNFFFKSSSIWYGKPILPHCVTSLECCYFYYARA